MKRMHRIFLSLFFALAIGFSFSVEASAHDYERSDGEHTYKHPDVEGVTAEQVEMAPAAAKEEMTRKLLLHAVEHLKLILEDPDLGSDLDPDRVKEAVIFAKALRDPGVFNHGDTYIIGITERGFVTSHGRYPNLIGHSYELKDKPLSTLVGAGNISDGADQAVCTPYRYEGQERTACAINQTTSSGKRTLIAGYHHAESALMAPDCSDLKLDVTAEEVENKTDLDEKRELLKGYVKNVIKVYRDLTLRLATQLFAEVGPERVQSELGSRFFEKIGCFRTPDFFHKSIYAFVMFPAEGISILNGLDFDLHGLSVSLEDPNPIPYDDKGNIESNVLDAFKKALTDGSGNLADLKEGKSAFVKYHWDNPVIEGDEVPDFLEKGVVPGTSVKESYLEVVNFAQGSSRLYVFGSGIYLEEDDDGGCAIASADNAPKSALLSLFLTASVLFSVVFLRKRV